MRDKYSGLQIGIHWLVFLLVVVAYAAMELRGFFPRSRPSGDKHDPRLLRYFHFCPDDRTPAGAPEVSGAADCS